MLKTLVESQLNVPRAAQKLVFRGKTLQDDDTMVASRLSEGAKVFLVTAKPAAAPAPVAAQTPAPVETKPAPASVQVKSEADPWAPLRALAERCLGKSDADRFLVEFKKKFELRLGSMSMDDIQRFCASDMTEF